MVHQEGRHPCSLAVFSFYTINPKHETLNPNRLPEWDTKKVDTHADLCFFCSDPSSVERKESFPDFGAA